MFSRKSNTVKRDAQAADHNMVLFPQKEIVLRGLIGLIEESFSFGNFNYRLLRRGIQKKKGRSAVTTHCHPTGVPSWLPIVHFFHRLISLFALFFSPFSPPALLPQSCGFVEEQNFHSHCTPKLDVLRSPFGFLTLL